MSNNILTQERLKELLHYDPQTGLFTWRVNISNIRAGSKSGCNDGGYLATRIDGIKYRMHRLAFLYMTGSMPKEVDHDNRIKSDNTWKNLNAATSLDNSRNLPKKKNNTSGITGVHRRKNKWIADIRVNGKQIYLGIYEDIKKAAKIRKEAEAFYGFHHSHGK